MAQPWPKSSSNLLNEAKFGRPELIVKALLRVFLTAIQHHSDVTMGAIASQITSPTIAYSTVFSDADQRKHQSSALLAFVRGIHRWTVNSPHKWPVTRKFFPFGDVIMQLTWEAMRTWWSLTRAELSETIMLFFCILGWICRKVSQKFNVVIDAN